MTNMTRTPPTEAGPDAQSQAPGKGRSGNLNSVLLVDGASDVRAFLQRGLQGDFALVEAANGTAAADALLERCHFDVIIAEVDLPGDSGVEWVGRLRERNYSTPVIFTSGRAAVDDAIAALRSDASDFILKPFTLEEMQTALRRTLTREERIRRENNALRRQVEHMTDSTGMVGSCNLIHSVCQVIKRVAPMPSTVLIEGESGTGKELAAHALHRWSGRDGSFVPVNCGSMNAELLESELFGHTRGAFTGANQAREGLFSYADGGTLFLDEIGEMPLGMQTHLLRVLEERAVRPVGGNRQVPVDVRVVAATNRELKGEVDKGRFREDLYYRLNVVTIRMPALRERLEDLPELVHHFIATLSRDLGIDTPAIDDSELRSLARYSWPGNIRELRNVIERCLLLHHRPSDCLAHLAGFEEGAEEDEEGDEALLLETVERRHILRVLDMESGNKSAAARRLGISRKTLERKVQAWGV